MLSKFLLGLIIFVATTSMAFAQCSCSHCSGGQSAYQNVVGQCACGSGDCCGDCGANSGVFGRGGYHDKCKCIGKCRCGLEVVGPCGTSYPQRLPSSPYDGRYNNSDWDHPFYGCCTPHLLDYPICDPCCRKPYVNGYVGYGQFQGVNRTDTFVTLGSVNILNPGTPPDFDDFLAERVDQEFRRTQGLKFHDGPAIGGAIGYRLHPALRLETEFGYREGEAESWVVNDTVTTRTVRFQQVNLNDATTILEDTQTSTTIFPAAGKLRSYSAMFNAVFDFSIQRIKCGNIYFGGGIGLAHVNGDFAVDFSSQVPAPVPAINDYRIDSTSFAYQFIGGVNVPLARTVELFGEYKYHGTTNVGLDNITSGVPLGQTNGVNSHYVFAGVRLYPKR
ncbi:MAG: outer membrane protein [Pirellulaceae bacterium]